MSLASRHGKLPGKQSLDRPHFPPNREVCSTVRDRRGRGGKPEIRLGNSVVAERRCDFRRQGARFGGTRDESLPLCAMEFPAGAGSNAALSPFWRDLLRCLSLRRQAHGGARRRNGRLARGSHRQRLRHDGHPGSAVGRSVHEEERWRQSPGDGGRLASPRCSMVRQTSPKPRAA
jgi:hypothetical protein